MKKFAVTLAIGFNLSIAASSFIDVNYGLIMAATEGRLDRVKDLVENHGANIDYQSSSLNLTALHYALLNGHRQNGQCEVAKYLIEKNAKKDIPAGFYSVTANELIEQGVCEGALGR